MSVTGFDGAVHSLLAIQAQRCADDYMEDGLLMCGTCRMRKQMRLNIALLGSEQVVAVACKCQLEERKRLDDERARAEFQKRIAVLRSLGIDDPTYSKYTFDSDDGTNPKWTDMCLRYVDHWREMRESNTGIIFYGPVGTGKSFFAACIANALLDRCISASVTTLGRVLNMLQSNYEDKQGVIDRMCSFELLVLDDLGAERDTSYAAEQVFNIIDARARSGKPMIITTNLTLEEMENPIDLQYRRVYDRALGACPIRVRMDGESKRKDMSNKRIGEARDILYGGKAHEE